MNIIDATALVIAKAPIAGFAKTRLSPPFSPARRPNWRPPHCWTR